MNLKQILTKPFREYKFYKAAKSNCSVPPGHYYSPDVNIAEVKQKESTIWNNNKNVNDVDLNDNGQIALLNEFSKYYHELPFDDVQKEGFRYYYKNSYYSYTDAITLYFFLRHYNPKNIIEIGSGFSSALMLDTKDKFKLSCNITFIEPFPVRLRSLLTNEDKNNYKIIESGVQEVSVEEFKKLGKGDILFIDSTHISKTGSDVNYILFEVFPVLQPGVLIHIHDVFSSFEYPKSWVYQGMSLNEDYILRAFLMNNNSYQIKMFPHYLHTHHNHVFNEMPLFYKNTGGNIWLEKCK